MCTFFVFKWFSTVSAQIFSESSFPYHSRELNEMNTVPVPIFQRGNEKLLKLKINVVYFIGGC